MLSATVVCSLDADADGQQGGATGDAVTDAEPQQQREGAEPAAAAEDGTAPSRDQQQEQQQEQDDAPRPPPAAADSPEAGAAGSEKPQSPPPLGGKEEQAAAPGGPGEEEDTIGAAEAAAEEVEGRGGASEAVLEGAGERAPSHVSQGGVAAFVPEDTPLHRQTYPWLFATSVRQLAEWMEEHIAGPEVRALFVGGGAGRQGALRPRHSPCQW